MDLSLTSRSKVDSYLGFLTLLLSKYPVTMTHADAFEKGVPEGQNTLLLRHDVDHDLERAVIMANLEAELGISSSYYLLPPGDYNSDENYYGRIVDGAVQHSDRLIEAAQEIVSLGHEIGLHNDFLQLSDRTKTPLEALIRAEIEYFGSHGIKIVGSASHGSKFARASGYTNYEIFLDRKFPDKSWKEVQLRDGGRYIVPAVSMRNLGLTYEAYDMARDARLSDVGGQLKISIGREAAESANFHAGAFDIDVSLPDGACIVLIHPEHWTPYEVGRASSAGADALKATGGIISKSALFPSKEVNAADANKPVFQRADGKPVRIAARGDCVCRRAVSLNRDLFQAGYDLVINEKATNRQFLETQKSPSDLFERAKQYVDVDNMVGSLKTYFQCQFDRSVLALEELDLLIMDTYSDMNFQTWRHKTEGWSMWIHRKYTDMEKLTADFDHVGFTPLEQSVEDTVAVIEKIREKNPDVPVLFMYQPVEYYSKLEGRTEYYDLPRLVSQRLPNIYTADQIAKNDLVTADMDSCGIGQTLHFGGETYRKMMTAAWTRGLSKHFQDPQPGQAMTFENYELPVELKDFAPQTVAYSAISYSVNSQQCRNACAPVGDAAVKSFAQYIYHPEHEEIVEEPKRFTPMVIDFAHDFSFEAFEASVKKFGKGERLREKRKALSKDQYCKPFAWKMHVPDVHEINHSKEVRSGGAMRGSYLRTVEEMGGAPDREYPVVFPLCDRHWSVTFGAFTPIEGYMQGTIETGEKLIAYISLRRIGDIVLYSQIMGHGDHLKDGTLVLLHHEVVKWLDDHRETYARDLRYIMYGGAQNGGQNLYQWKRRSGFKPLQLIAFSTKNKLEDWLDGLA